MRAPADTLKFLLDETEIDPFIRTKANALENDKPPSSPRAENEQRPVSERAPDAGRGSATPRGDATPRGFRDASGSVNMAGSVTPQRRLDGSVVETPRAAGAKMLMPFAQGGKQAYRYGRTALGVAEDLQKAALVAGENVEYSIEGFNTFGMIKDEIDIAVDMQRILGDKMAKLKAEAEARSALFSWRVCPAFTRTQIRARCFVCECVLFVQAQENTHGETRAESAYES